MAWEPISSAPKTGVPIVCCGPRMAPRFVVWKTNHRIVTAQAIGDQEAKKVSASYFGDPDQWDDYALARPENAPTHWHALPMTPYLESVIKPDWREEQVRARQARDAAVKTARAAVAKIEEAMLSLPHNFYIRLWPWDAKQNDFFPGTRRIPTRRFETENFVTIHLDGEGQDVFWGGKLHIVFDVEGGCSKCITLDGKNLPEDISGYVKDRMIESDTSGKRIF